MKEIFPVVILAGGLATRLRPLTEKIPKSLIEINGEPFIVHQLRLLRQSNVRKVILCVGYLGEQIQDYLGDGSKFNLDIVYVYDGPKLLGTGGAIKKALPHIHKHFFVLYGDSYLPCCYQVVQAAFEKSEKLGLMTIFKNNGLWDTSNIEFQNGNIIRYDKKNCTKEMHYIDYGLGILSKQTFDKVPEDRTYDLADLYQSLLGEQQLAAYEIKQRFYEVGSFVGVNELENYLAEKTATVSNH